MTVMHLRKQHWVNSCVVFRKCYVPKYYFFNDVLSRKSGHTCSVHFFFLAVHDVPLALPTVLDFSISHASPMALSFWISHRYCASPTSCNSCSVFMHYSLIVMFNSEVAVFYWGVLHKKLWPERVLWATCSTLEEDLEETVVLLVNIFYWKQLSF